MAKLDDYITAQREYNAAMSVSVDGLVGDVQVLNDKITKLENAPGGTTPEQDAALEELKTAGAALRDRLAAADALTAPVPPA